MEIATQWLDYDPDSIDVRITELLVATSEASDPLVDPKVQEALSLYRTHLDMDVVYVAQSENHNRTFRTVDNKPGLDLLQVGQSDPVEQSWCQHVVSGRLPQLVVDAKPYLAQGVVPPVPLRIGTHLSTPILMRNGSMYGTLCCFSQDVHEDVGIKDVQRLQAMARALAIKLEASLRAREAAELAQSAPPVPPPL